MPATFPACAAWGHGTVVGFHLVMDRNLVVKQMVQMKNRVSGLLMETG